MPLTALALVLLAALLHALWLPPALALGLGRRAGAVLALS